MSKNKSKGMILDGIFSSESWDTSGELVELSGLNVSSLKEGKGFVDCEHILPGEKTGAGSTFNTIIGHVLKVKKIYKVSDCENERQRFYWDKIELPFLYGMVELFDAEDHQNAKAAAAMIRYYVKRDLPILLKFSIEGHTLSRDKENPKIISRSFARGVALTIKPANHSAISGLIEDTEVKTPSEPIVKSELCSFEVEYVPFLEPYIEEINKNTDFLSALNKTLSAGQSDAAPSTLTGMTALSPEDIAGKKKLFKAQVMALARDWDGNGDFRQLIKTQLPDTDPDFIDHFDDIADDITLKNIKLKKYLEIINKNTDILSKS